MKKKWIIIGIIILLLIIGGIFIFRGFFYNLLGLAVVNGGEERLLYTDRPGELVGKDYIDGEVFIIDENDSFFRDK